MARYYKRKRIGANVYTQGKFGKGLREIVDTDNPLLYSIFYSTLIGDDYVILTLYEPFRHWSETGSVYILADPHFGDSDCKLMDPGWIEPEEQVARINALVMKNDTFVCLGDVGDASFVKQIRARKKILLLGNHDKKKDYKGLFDEIYDGPLLIAEKILLSHEPVYGLPWCLNIHGHDHGNIESYKEGCKHLNLAANVCGYTPVSLGKLIKGGILSDITSIHRITIDRATEKKEKWHGEAFSDN